MNRMDYPVMYGHKIEEITPVIGVLYFQCITMFLFPTCDIYKSFKVLYNG